jgi:hypothetical protein
VTGILAASVIAGLGLFIIPHRRRQVTAKFLQKTEDLRIHLSAALTDQFQRETQRAAERIRDAIAPYVRFVRAEYDRVSQIRAELSASRATLERLRSEIERATGAATRLASAS